MQVSRLDALVDALLDERIAADAGERRRLEALKGRAGVANAKVVYERFRSYLSGRDWQLIAASGAKVQRLLWASAGVTGASYPDVLYADELIGDRTAISLPEATWRAFNDHGTPARTVDRHLDDAHRTLRELSRLGIDVERLGTQLQSQEIEQARHAWQEAVAAVDTRRLELLGEEVPT